MTGDVAMQIAVHRAPDKKSRHQQRQGQGKARQIRRQRRERREQRCEKDRKEQHPCEAGHQQIKGVMVGDANDQGRQHSGQHHTQQDERRFGPKEIPTADGAGAPLGRGAHQGVRLDQPGQQESAGQNLEQEQEELRPGDKFRIQPSIRQQQLAGKQRP